MPHRIACRVWTKDKVGFKDCQEDGTVGDEQADARDDEEGNQGEEEAVLEGESHGHEELCRTKASTLARSGIMTMVTNATEMPLSSLDSCLYRQAW